MELYPFQDLNSNIEIHKFKELGKQINSLKNLNSNIEIHKFF